MVSLLAAALTGALLVVEAVRRRQVRDLTRTVDYLRGRNQQLWNLYADERRVRR